MPITVQCRCGRITHAPDASLGKKGRCKGCGEIMTISAATVSAGYEVEQPPPFPADPRPSRNESMRPIAVQQVVHAEQATIIKGNALAIASLVLGIIAAVVCVVPFVGLFAVVLGGVGLVLGAIGTALAIAGKRSGLAASIAGMILSVSACVGSYAITRAYLRGVAESLKEAQAEREPAVVAKVDPAAPKEAPKLEPELVLFPAAASVGTTRLRIVSIERGKVPLAGGFREESKSHDDHLLFSLLIENLDQNKKINIYTYAPHDYGDKGAKLTDNLGNDYRASTFGISSRLAGTARFGSLHPGKTVSDRIAFELPVEKAEFLVLELPGGNIDLSDTVFRFKIPVSAITGQAAPAVRADPVEPTVKPDAPQAGPEESPPPAADDRASRAASALRTARNLEKSGRKATAVKAYRQIAAEFDGLGESAIARSKLKALGATALKPTDKVANEKEASVAFKAAKLLEADKPLEALGEYRELVREFPFTDAAKLATARIKVLAP